MYGIVEILRSLSFTFRERDREREIGAEGFFSSRCVFKEFIGLQYQEQPIRDSIGDQILEIEGRANSIGW